ncbi:hypothetical protein EDB83DRAFT_2524017 [Lactarius deliciosus]|nr:hypothetical protein EDB83DRAFT_2524017 [Lactarius deliciosus]
MPWTGYWFITDKAKIAVDLHDGWWVKIRYNEENKKLENLEELYQAAEEAAEDIAECPEEPEEEEDEQQGHTDAEGKTTYQMATQTLTQVNYALLNQTTEKPGDSGGTGGGIPNNGQPNGGPPGGGMPSGGGGPPGGGRGPPGGGGGPPAGNPGPGPHAPAPGHMDSKLKGNAPEVFDGTRAKAKSWKEAVELYCLINNQHPKI